jgi:peptide/nickel transport system substrate-binding protein
VASWVRGQALTLVADSTGGLRTKIARVVWRFGTDMEAALNLVLSGEADLLEVVGTPERVARVEADSLLRAIRYPAAAYGFVGYRVMAACTAARPCGPTGDRAVRRALNMAVDRQTIARAILGEGTRAPPGPMSQLLWIWDDSVATLPYDTVAAGRALDAAGWRRGPDGMRRRGSTPLAFDLLVPATSVGRKRLAEVLQETWRLAGARVTVTAVDFPVFQQRLGEGRFDAYIGAWLDEPSPRGIDEQWTAAGVGGQNFGGYTSPAFDAAFARAAEATSVPAARTLWREALDTLNADAPALFLYAPANVAAASRRITGFAIDPYSWLSGLTEWSLTRP